ncbi:uncharacterized protein [Clytia hemisphaerica]
MIEQLQRHVFCWCLFMACYLHHNAVIGKVFPSIIWSPYNPLFSCEEPTLNVRVDDIVKFICPYYDVGFVQPEDSLDKPLYENMYLVKEDRNAFDQCDASGSGSDEQILKCDQLPSSANSNRLRFIKTQTFPGQMYYEEGKSYYFIGTGYRTAENVNNTIGGSCNTTENEFQYKLRLKVYICRQDEVCRTCNTAQCYSKGVTCPHCNPWSEIEKTPSADFTQLSLNETRWCRDGNDNKTEFKQRDCDLQCEDWKEFDEEQDEGCIILNGNTTTTPKKDNQLCGMTSKRCQSNQCNKEINFCAFSTCTTSKPTTRSQSGTPEVEKQVGPGEAKESNKFLYISIPMFLVLFALGILVGILAFKRYHQKKCLNFIMRPNQVDVGEERGNVNLAYQSSVIEKRPNAQSVYYANESDSVHCDTFDEESKS